VDRLTKLTPLNVEVRSLEVNDQEMKHAAVLVEKKKEKKILKRKMKLKDDSITSLSSKVD
jgi:hypothetical protein